MPEEAQTVVVGFDDVGRTMTIPERLGPGFEPLSCDRLPPALQALANHIYVKMQRTPGLPSEAPSMAVELYIDFSEGALGAERSESERPRSQTTLARGEGLHIVANEHRSQLQNLNAALDELGERFERGEPTW